MGAAGFYKAPFTKATIAVVGGMSLVASMLEIRPTVGLGLEHLTTNLQLWRLLTHHLVFRTSSELLLASVALYEFRQFERRFGTSKFAAFAFTVSAFSTLFQIALLTLQTLWEGGSAEPPFTAPGPYGFVFALLVPYVQLVPVTQTWSLVGLNLSHKTFFYAILTQLVLCQYPSSLIPCLSGILSGMLYVTDFGSVQSWRFPRPIEGFFSANVLPSIASLSPYGNAASSTWQQSRQPNGVLATLDSNGQPVPRSGQLASSPSGNVRYRAAPGGAAAAPAPYIPPTEEQIENIQRLGFGREQVLRAMQRANNNEQRAINFLLDDSH